jgi:hypothetical protein
VKLSESGFIGLIDQQDLFAFIVETRFIASVSIALSIMVPFHHIPIRQSKQIFLTLYHQHARLRCDKIFFAKVLDFVRA